MKLVQVHRKFGKPWSEDQKRKRSMVRLLREDYSFTGKPHPPKAYLLTDILERIANAGHVDEKGFSFFSQEDYCAKGWAHPTTVRKALLWLVEEKFLLAHKDNKLPYLGAKRYKLNADRVPITVVREQEKKEASASRPDSSQKAARLASDELTPPVDSSDFDAFLHYMRVSNDE